MSNPESGCRSGAPRLQLERQNVMNPQIPRQCVIFRLRAKRKSAARSRAEERLNGSGASVIILTYMLVE